MFSFPDPWSHWDCYRWMAEFQGQQKSRNTEWHQRGRTSERAETHQQNILKKLFSTQYNFSAYFSQDIHMPVEHEIIPQNLFTKFNRHHILHPSSWPAIIRNTGPLVSYKAEVIASCAFYGMTGNRSGHPLWLDIGFLGIIRLSKYRANTCTYCL